jgi:hypothetical protein
MTAGDQPVKALLFFRLHEFIYSSVGDFLFCVPFMLFVTFPDCSLHPMQSLRIDNKALNIIIIPIILLITFTELLIPYILNHVY